jgi:hypothetical protein
MRHLYWLVFRNDKAEALVRSGESSANTVAGDKLTARDSEKRNAGAFKNGEPDTLSHPHLCFQLLGSLEAWSPLISEWIEKLGPPVDGTAKRLKDSQRRAKASKVTITDSDVANMRRLRSNGLSFTLIGDRTGYSCRTVRRYLSGARVPVSGAALA